MRSRENYRIIERTLTQLDRPKLQVAIDVTIAEVTLNDELSYGVQFFLSNQARHAIGSISSRANGSTPPSEPPAAASTSSWATRHARTSSSTRCTSIPT